MTLATPTPATGGTEATLTSTAPRRATRRPSGKHDHDADARDHSTKGSPALVFLAILQGMPALVAPVKSALAVAGHPSDGKERLIAGVTDRPSPAPGSAPADPRNGTPKLATAPNARKPAATMTATDGSKVGNGASRVPINALLAGEKKTTPAKLDSVPADPHPNPLPGGNPSQYPEVTATPTLTNGGSGAASSRGQPPFQSPNASDRTALPRLPGAGASSPTSLPQQPFSSQPAGDTPIPTWEMAKPPVDLAGTIAPTKLVDRGSAPTNVPTGVMGMASLPGVGAHANTTVPAGQAQTVPAQVIQQLLERPPQAETTVVIHLDPPLLGSVVLRVVAGTGRRLRLHFEVDDSSVGDALASGLGQLESALRAQGLSPEGFSVGLNNAHFDGGQSGSSGQNSSLPFPGERAGAPVALTPPSPVLVPHMRANGGRYIDYLL